MKQTEFWDKEANNPEVEAVRGEYLTHLFLKAVNKGLSYISEEPVQILKVDLWNEGIDVERDILKHYQIDKFRLFGGDISFKVCKNVFNKKAPIHIANLDITNLPYHNESFNIILDLSTSDHIPGQQIPQVFEQYYKCLKKQGVFILIFDCWGLIWKIYLKYIDFKKKKKSDINTWRYLHSIKFIKENLKRFKILDEYCLDYTGWMWNRFTFPLWKRLPWNIYEILLNFEYSRFSKHLKFFAKQYVIICEKK